MVTEAEPCSEELWSRLARLNEVGVALSTKEDFRELMEMILLGAKELTNADAGTLYRVTDNDTLVFEIVRTDSLNLSWGGVAEDPVPFPEISLYGENREPNKQMVVCYCALTGETLNIEDAYQIDQFDFSGTRQFDVKTGYRSRSFLNVPLKNHRKEVIGVLQLLNAQDKDTGEVTAFSEADQRLVESLGSQAAIALSNRQLITSLNGMLEGFIEAIAEGIDQQSRYTGDHCRRVPIIAEMLAEAVNEANEGFFTKSDLYELHIAALLHDCGKVATPIHITDKATRQETVLDAIDHINTRFQLKRKETELESLRNQEDPDVLRKKLEQIDNDIAFLEKCNQPTTFMDDEAKERVREIAEGSWTDSYGVEQPMITEQELTNFMITRGTLNDEERKIINNHVVSSIKMLENLPYPKHLARVPEIAGAHHEWLNGNGYPKQLTAKDMSTQARILCIADVFEALTAHDRPYKPPMPLSKAVRILREQIDKGHLDGDLVDLFIERGVHVSYANKYLHQEQLDL